MKDKYKMIDKFINQELIGYTENFELILRAIVHYTDGLIETMYAVDNQERRVREWSTDCPKIHREVKQFDFQ
jgi:hypothetical protein